MADDLGYNDIPWNNKFLTDKMPNVNRLHSESIEIPEHYRFVLATLYHTIQLLINIYTKLCLYAVYDILYVTYCMLHKV